MKSNDYGARALSASKLSALVLALIPTTQAAHASNLDRLMRDDFATKQEWRAARQEARFDRIENRGRGNDLNFSTLAVPSIDSNTSSHTGAMDASTAGSLNLSKRDLNALRRSSGILPGQISEFRTTRPEPTKAVERAAVSSSTTSNRSTFTNDDGKTKFIHRGVSLDLSSSDATITIGSNLLGDSTITIEVGGETKQISAGTQVTPAEFAALNQKLNGGNQDLVLNGQGAAIDGFLSINTVTGDRGRSITSSELVIPENVTVSGDFGRHADGVRVTNDLVNYGSLYAVSSNKNRNTAVIGARDITNQSGGLISSDAPQEVSNRFGETDSNLNLELRADRDLNNDGTISSSGTLTLTAGRSLNNSGSITANSFVALNTPVLNNSGSVSSINSSINIASPVNSNLTINATGGSFNATNGDINIATTIGDNQKTNTNIVDGDWNSKKLNVNSGDGIVSANVGNVTGMVNINAGIIQFNANAQTLLTGSMNATGDPLLSNAGDIVIGADINSLGQPISIVAGGNISLAPGVTIISSGNPTGNGGSILISAGADFTTQANTITIVGKSTTGGSIDFTDLVYLTSSSGSNSGLAGNITVVATSGSDVNSGKIVIGGSVAAESPGVGVGGAIFIAGESSSDAITVNDVIAGGDFASGAVTLAAGVVNLSAPIVINATPGPTEGAQSGGNYTVPTTYAGDIIANDITTGGGNVFVAGHNIQLGDIKTSANFRNAGGVSISSEVANGDVTVGSITANTIDMRNTGAIFVQAQRNLTVGPIQALTDNGIFGGAQLRSVTGTMQVGSIDIRSYNSFSSPLTIESGSSLTLDGDIVMVAPINLPNVISIQAAGNLTFTPNATQIVLDNAGFASVSISANAIEFQADDTRIANIGSALSINSNQGIVGSNSLTLQSGAGLNVNLGNDTFDIGRLNLQATNEINLNGANVTASSTNIAILPAITATAGGAISTGSLTVTSPTANFGVTLQGADITTGTITTDEPVTGDGAVSLTVATNSFIPPTINAGSGQISITNQQANGTVTLGAQLTGGGITAKSGGDIIVNSLSTTGDLIDLESTSGNIDLGANNVLAINPFNPFPTGSIRLKAENAILTSASSISISAGSTTDVGGTISVNANSIAVPLTMNVNGAQGGGTVAVGVTTGTLSIAAVSAKGTSGSAFGGVVGIQGDTVHIDGIIDASGGASSSSRGTIEILSSTNLTFNAGGNAIANGGTQSTSINLISNGLINFVGSNFTLNANAGAGSLIYIESAGNISTNGRNLTLNTTGSVNVSAATAAPIVLSLASSAAAGGVLTVSAGGGVTLPTVSTAGLTTGGNVTVTGTSINLNGINTTGTSSAGTVSVTGSGAIVLGGSITTSDLASGKSVSITSNGNNISLASDINITTTGSTGSGNVILKGDSIQLNNFDLTILSSNGVNNVGVISLITNAAGVVTNGGNLNATAAGTLSVGGNINTSTNTGNSGDVSLVSDFGNVSVFNITTAGIGAGDAGDVTLRSANTGTVSVGPVDAGAVSGDAGLISIAGRISSVGTLTADTVTLDSKGTATLTLNTITRALNLSAAGQININNLNSLDLGTIEGTTVNITADGTIRTTQDIDAVSTRLHLEANGGNINIDNSISVNNAEISLRVVGGGQITESVGGALIATGATGTLKLDLALGTSTANLTRANNVTNLEGQNSGTIVLNNGANALEIVGLGANQNVFLTTTSASGISVTTNDLVNTNGTISLSTPRYYSTRGVSSTNILIQNLAGDLIVEGDTTAGASLTATNPAAGTPGNPSTPTAINIVTASGANLTLKGLMSFTGDTTLNNDLGATTSTTGSLFSGNQNVILRTSVWNTTGSQIVGNNFIFEAQGGNIVNTAGDVTITSNIIFRGKDLAILASGDINVTGNVTIDLSSSTSAGYLTMLAGYDLSPTTTPQDRNSLAYTVGAISSTGGDINASGLTINLSASGNNNFAGTLTAVTGSGSITLGDINTSNATFVAGDVDISARDSITTGAINANGSSLTGRVNLRLQVPTIEPNTVITNGSLTSGGITEVDVYTPGNVTVGDITASDVKISTAGTTAHTVSIQAVNTFGLTVAANQSTLNLPSNTLNLSQAPDGSGAFVSITAGQITGATPGAISINADGTIRGGAIAYTKTTASSLTVGGTGISFSAKGDNDAGRVEVRNAGDIVIEAGGIDATGLDGDGQAVILESIGTLTLNTTDFLNGDATGANAHGGILDIRGADIIVPATAAAQPLLLSATGTGTGGGGSITFRTGNTTPLYVGTPAKAPKPPAVYLELDASGGVDGDSGNVTVATGGSLYVDPTAAKASGGGANATGSNYEFAAGTTLIVNGSLDARGRGTGTSGLINLSSNSKTAFDIDLGKTPKNGTLGPLLAGDESYISISNLGGSVNVNSYMEARGITLVAGGKGGINFGKTASIEAQFVGLFADTGAIGKKALTITAEEVQAGTSGKVSLINQFAGPSKVSGSAGKGGFNYTALGNGLTVDGILVQGGDINVTAATGVLTITDTPIFAREGEIALINSDVTAGSINILDAAYVSTIGNKSGQIVIAIGEAPKKPVNTYTSTGIKLEELGKGKIYLESGTDGIVSIATTIEPTLRAQNKAVIIKNGSTSPATNQIRFGEDAGVWAGAGTAFTSVGAPIHVERMSGSDSSFKMMTSSASVSDTVSAKTDATSGTGVSFKPTSFIAPQTVATAPTLDSIQQPSILTSQNESLVSASRSAMLFDQQTLSFNNQLVASELNSTARGAQNETAVQDAKASVDVAGASLHVASAGVELGSAGVQAATVDTQSELPQEDLIVEAAFHGLTNSEMSRFAINNISDVSVETVSAGSNSVNKLVLKNGNVVFAPDENTFVDTKHGTISIAAKSVVIVSQTRDSLSVFNIDDHGKDAVVLSAHGKRISLSPGLHATVTPRDVNQFCDVNQFELVQHRDMKTSKTNLGANVFTSEFSIPSACFAVKPLRHLVSSKHNSVAKTKAHMLKTSAVILSLRPDRGDYIQHFKPRMTAFK